MEKTTLAIGQNLTRMLVRYREASLTLFVKIADMAVHNDTKGTLDLGAGSHESSPNCVKRVGRLRDADDGSLGDGVHKVLVWLWSMLVRSEDHLSRSRDQGGG